MQKSPHDCLLIRMGDRRRDREICKKTKQDKERKNNVDNNWQRDENEKRQRKTGKTKRKKKTEKTDIDRQWQSKRGKRETYKRWENKDRQTKTWSDRLDIKDRQRKTEVRGKIKVRKGQTMKNEVEKELKL